MITKFDLGQTVWYTITGMYGAQVECGTITQIQDRPLLLFYRLDNGGVLCETRIYETRDEAFKAAISWCAQHIRELRDEIARLKQLRRQAQDTQ